MQPGMEVIYTSSSYEEFENNWNEKPVDMVLCDIGLPGKSGIEATWNIKRISPATQVMMLTVFEEKEKIFQSLCAGASGYMLKSAPLEDIKSGIRDILNGGAAMSPKIAKQVIGFFSRKGKTPEGDNIKLTPREIEILSLLELGMTNKEIAEKIFLSVDTVKFHIKNIYLKLQVNSRVELITKYRSRL